MNAFLSQFKKLFRTRARKAAAALVTLGFALPLLAAPESAHAGLMSWLIGLTGSAVGDVSGWVIGFSAFVLGYLWAMVVGLLIAVASFLVEVTLQLNTHIVNAPAVQMGFDITLSLANLGFVLGAIVIAIATIIRYESYGMKRLLRNLIIAALLVNFSLVIAGTIVNFADRLSMTFISAFPGTAGSGAAGKVAGFHNFAAGLAGAFNPQRNFIGQAIDDLGGREYDMTATGGGMGGADSEAARASLGGQGFGMIVQPIFQLLFAIFSSVFILFALLLFVVLLMIRYIYLGVLLILMPLAWLLWIFPITEGNWKKWWQKFLKWTFFAPVSLFFIWLVILTSQRMNSASRDPLQGIAALGYVPPSGDPNSVMSVLASSLGGAWNQIIGTFLQAVLLLGLTIGGFLAANAMALETSKAAQKIAGAASTWLGRRTLRGTTRALGRLGGAQLAKTIQEQGLGGLRSFRSNIGGNRNMLFKALNGTVNTMMRGIGYGVSLPGAAVKGTGKVVGSKKLEERGEKIMKATDRAIGIDYIARLGGRGMQYGLRRGGAGVFAEEEKNLKEEVKGATNAELVSLLRSRSMNAEREAALLKMMMEKGALKDALDQRELWAPERKESFESIGQGELFENLQKYAPGIHERKAVEALGKPYDDARQEARRNAEQAFETAWSPEERAAMTTEQKEMMISEAAEKEFQRMQNKEDSTLNKALESVNIDLADGTQVSALDHLNKSMEKLIAITAKNAKTGYKAYYGDKPMAGTGATMGQTLALRRALTENLVKANPHKIGNEIPQMNYAEMKQFTGSLQSYLDNEIPKLERSGADEKILKQMKDVNNNLRRIIARQAVSSGAHGEEHPPEEHEEHGGGNIYSNVTPLGGGGNSGGGSPTSHT